MIFLPKKPSEFCKMHQNYNFFGSVQNFLSFSFTRGGWCVWEKRVNSTRKTGWEWNAANQTETQIKQVIQPLLLGGKMVIQPPNLGRPWHSSSYTVFWQVKRRKKWGQDCASADLITLCDTIIDVFMIWTEILNPLNYTGSEFPNSTQSRLFARRVLLKEERLLSELIIRGEGGIATGGGGSMASRIRGSRIILDP